jgi:hypothetical protein
VIFLENQEKGRREKLFLHLPTRSQQRYHSPSIVRKSNTSRTKNIPHEGHITTDITPLRIHPYREEWKGLRAWIAERAWPAIELLGAAPIVDLFSQSIYVYYTSLAVNDVLENMCSQFKRELGIEHRG